MALFCASIAAFGTASGLSGVCVMNGVTGAANSGRSIRSIPCRRNNERIQSRPSSERRALFVSSSSARSPLRHRQRECRHRTRGWEHPTSHDPVDPARCSGILELPGDDSCFPLSPCGDFWSPVAILHSSLRGCNYVGGNHAVKAAVLTLYP